MGVAAFSIETEALRPYNVTVVRVAGYLDAHTFEALEDTLNELFRKQQFRVVVDLSKVEYISSAGAGVFIGALSEAQEQGGNIILMDPTSNVREVFDLLGLTQVFQIVKGEEAALATFAGAK
jgi:anti-sigma B factor antagonist